MILLSFVVNIVCSSHCTVDHNHIYIKFVLYIFDITYTPNEGISSKDGILSKGGVCNYLITCKDIHCKINYIILLLCD